MYRRNMSGNLKKVVMFIRLSILLLLSGPFGTTIGLIRKKATLYTCSTLFLYISLPLFFARPQRETSRNFFMEEMSYVFSFTFFFTHFLLALVAASIVTAATKFSCCSSNKKMSLLFFISRSRSLSPFFSLSFAGLPLFLFFYVFLLLYIQICGHDN